MNVIDLPALAEEYDALADIAGPMTSQRLTEARGIVSRVHSLAGEADGKFGRALAALVHGEPGTDYDFLVRDLLELQGFLCRAQTQLASSMRLLMRANISLTAACTMAAHDGDASE